MFLRASLCPPNDMMLQGAGAVVCGVKPGLSVPSCVSFLQVLQLLDMHVGLIGDSKLISLDQCVK